MKRFVISDLHFGHKNLAYIRDFANVEEHDETLINNWNKAIPKANSMVYILGDVTLHNTKHFASNILPRLNGEQKILVSGNHDDKDMVNCFDSTYGAIVVRINDNRYVMTHIPIHPQELYTRWHGNIHGHLHNKFVFKDWQDICGDTQGTIKDKRYINVSAEQLSYTPQILEDVVGN
tara:strand:+ start:1450 stop:1980 length:531 start_codon:yes stop_codon:yes gene_type:complete